MEDIFYVINLDRLNEVFNKYVEKVEERMIETEVNEVHELIDGEFILTRKDVKKQLVSNESKLKLNQVLTHCLEIILIDKDSIIDNGGEDIIIEENNTKSDSYMMAIRTLMFYGILERKN